MMELLGPDWALPLFDWLGVRRCGPVEFGGACCCGEDGGLAIVVPLGEVPMSESVLVVSPASLLSM